MKSASSGKNISGHPDIKENANAKLNAFLWIPSMTYMQLQVATCWKISTFSIFSCEKVVRHFLVNNPCDI
jgi:hypothetical protein